MRRRILRATVAAVVCAVLLFAMPLGFAALRLYEQDEVRELQQLAEQVAVSVPAQVHSPADPMELPRTEPGTQIAVYDSGLRRMIGAGPASGDESVRAASAGRASSQQTGGGLVVAVPVGSGEQVRAVVRVGSKTAEPLRRAALTWAGMLVLAAFAVGVGVLIALRSSRRLARPLEALAATAGRLETGDLSARAATSGLPEADEVATTLNRAAGRIHRLLQRERAFSADASHQLRTALTRTRLDLESSLADQGLRVPAQGPYAAMRSALESLNDMQATLDDLLALARDDPERAPLDIGTLLAEAERRWHGELAASGRPLRIVAEDDLPETVGSSRAARQVLDVLLSNAAAHGKGTVTVRARETAGVVAVDVEDEGSELPDDVDIFARRQATGGGLGIGLALARSLVEAEGGRLFLSRQSPHPRFTWLVATSTGAGDSDP
ncbi:HAMP domain-containing sensor histidine kinase [Planotetraspora phitsanulokensis]|uniref:histidine kinase n=1 Tax=Planotetraspora phitsanulokensis TaxID=575192 RepID=A0A8J3UCU7_9ACTN|nr:HAMP domain-containing sensor histidine kinase [Planotetraspora phitsanulokensis]GII40981.1 two-component sensor histidine kinase [Planotetraspora phitsanulokensis]